MNKTSLLNAGLIAVSTLLAIFVSAYIYLIANTHPSPKFFPTELKEVQDDFNIHYVESGSRNPDYHPTYKDEQAK